MIYGLIIYIYIKIIYIIYNYTYIYDMHIIYVSYVWWNEKTKSAPRSCATIGPDRRSCVPWGSHANPMGIPLGQAAPRNREGAQCGNSETESLGPDHRTGSTGRNQLPHGHRVWRILLGPNPPKVWRKATVHICTLSAHFVKLWHCAFFSHLWSPLAVECVGLGLGTGRRKSHGLSHSGDWERDGETAGWWLDDGPCTTWSASSK